MELRDQLQSTLSGTYTLGRELGGGGMSRVFVADETRLGRRVVVKVLAPDLAAGISAERFEREIRLAASLQQANIVPVLSVGDAAGLPYYTMPFVEGESLRSHLAKRPALPITEVVGILRDVAKALAYAHERGVVHRDIKPDNVLLSGGTAVVTDFGIAKAISASRTSSGAGSATLTQVGTSIGTPAYMSPEQAAGDPDVDHRADVYAFGAMAFELLSGYPPFHGRTPQRTLAAQMSEPPRQITELRPDTPAALADLVMRCLAKEAGARPQNASDLVRVLDGVATSGGGLPAMPEILRGGRGRLTRALMIWAAASFGVVIVARAAIIAIGLPDWVFPGAIIVMLLGLPMILFTGYVHRTTTAILTRTPTLTPGGTTAPHGTMATLALKASPHVTWRRTTLGGIWAGVAFVALVGGYMLLRALGIGPAGSLMAAGSMTKNERVIVTDFGSPAGDSTLGPVIAEALRTDLGQSTALSVVQQTAIREVLTRMKRPTTARVDLQLAREIATREGMKAILDGDIAKIGGTYTISVRLVSVDSAQPLASFRENAADSTQIIGAVAKLTKALRAKVGESLKSVRAAPPLEQVTTSSLDALRKFVQGSHASDVETDYGKAIGLLEQATTIDTGFAMAYRKLGVALLNMGGQSARAFAMLQKAFDHRDRLSDAERYFTEGSYYYNGPAFDAGKAIAALEALVELKPDHAGALNNLANVYGYNRDYARAVRTLERGFAADSSLAVVQTNLIRQQFTSGHAEDAMSSLVRMQRLLPDNPGARQVQFDLLAARGKYDSAAALASTVSDLRRGDLNLRAAASSELAAVSRIRGQLHDARRWIAAEWDASAQGGERRSALMAELDRAWLDVWFLDEKEAALRIVDAALKQHPLSEIPDVERPYGFLVDLYAFGGQPARARAVMDERNRLSNLQQRGEARAGHEMKGAIALAEKRYDDAAKEYRAADEGGCNICELPLLARAYDLGGQPDSAIVMYERFVTTPYVSRVYEDESYLAGTLKRLGELYEAKGDRAKAVSYYSRFVDLWKSADPELQPFVADVKKRITRLSEGGDR
jgi:tetratricopeptide (TPR) repeat protein/tRNA A-37 threonylcarbamoyl transferase component Bud32